MASRKRKFSDIDLSDEPSEGTPPARRPDGKLERFSPVNAAARALVRRMLADDPGLPGAAREAGAVIVVEVPGSDWIYPVAEAWRLEVLATESVPEDGDGNALLNSEWLEFRRKDPARHNDQTALKRISHALSHGKPVYGFSHNPAQCLPPGLLLAANQHVKVPRLDGATLVEAMRLYYGVAPASVPVDTAASLVTSVDLLLSWRSDRNPDAHIERALSLAAVRTRSRSDTPRLEDLCGMDEAVRWGLDLKRDLQAFRSGRLTWRDVDRGVLLAGPTGTGKTTFARALAATCAIPLVIGSLAGWQASEKAHLGDMLKAMRTTFDEARSLAPCILFIDEVDGVGDRETFHATHRDYHVQVLNSLLELLDGVQSREGVVIVAATNRPTALDAALTRPGRLDRTISIGLPDAAALAGILRHHLGDDLTGVDLSTVAQTCDGMTGAHLERAVRGMRRRARRESRSPTLADLEAELNAEQMPIPKATRQWVSIHESALAVSIAVCRPGVLKSVSVPRATRQSGVFGAVVTTEELFGSSGPTGHVTREKVLVAITERLAGRAAELVLLGEVSGCAGGLAQSDIARATWLATCAVSALGLGHDPTEPPVWRGIPTAEQVPVILAMHESLSREVCLLLADGHKRAVDLVLRHKEAVLRVASELRDRETLTGKEVEGIVLLMGATVQ